MYDRTTCPACGHKGRRVGLITVRSLVKDPTLVQSAALSAAPVHECATGGGTSTGCAVPAVDEGWRFCVSPDCDIVYYNVHTGTLIPKHLLRVPVGIKEKTGERPLCYCFGHSVESIKQELRTKGRSDALDDIKKKMKDPGCRCQVTNPSGSCCLGTVAWGIKVAKQELVSELPERGANMSVVSPVRSPRDINAGRSGHAKATVLSLLAAIGGVFSALLATACCWLPLLAVSAGISGAGLAATVEHYRPFFGTLAVIFLGVAWHLTYRPRRADNPQDSCCSDDAQADGACCVSTKGPSRLRHSLNRALLPPFTLVVLLLLFWPSLAGYLSANKAEHPSGNEAGSSKLVFRVEGIACYDCARHIRELVGAIPGVTGVDISTREGLVTVAVDPCCNVRPETILRALSGAGYKAELVPQSPGSARSP